MSDVTCPTCEGRGKGHVPADHFDCGDCYDGRHPCPDCDGTGKYVTGSWPLGMTARMADAPCPDCKGTGTAAAPAVDTDLWCEHREYVFPTGLRHPDRHGFNPCPGPHRTLILGPEVDDA